MAASLGKTPTTSVRRLISGCTRSSGLVDQICHVGKRSQRISYVCDLALVAKPREVAAYAFARGALASALQDSPDH